MMDEVKKRERERERERELNQLTNTTTVSLESALRWSEIVVCRLHAW